MGHTCFVDIMYGCSSVSSKFKPFFRMSEYEGIWSVTDFSRFSIEVIIWYFGLNYCAYIWFSFSLEF